jgi:hypothetical protein
MAIAARANLADKVGQSTPSAKRQRPDGSSLSNLLSSRETALGGGTVVEGACVGIENYTSAAWRAAHHASGFWASSAAYSPRFLPPSILVAGANLPSGMMHGQRIGAAISSLAPSTGQAILPYDVGGLAGTCNAFCKRINIQQPRPITATPLPSICGKRNMRFQPRGRSSLPRMGR